MSIGKRIKFLRNTLGLNQSEFAAPLGLTYAAIGTYENELRNVSEPSILSICREYRVNEKWLRTGDGDIYSTNYMLITRELAKEHDLNEFDQRLIIEYLKLDKNSRAVLKEYLSNVLYYKGHPY